MNPVARQSLEKLLRSAENASSKESVSRAISLRFSEKALPSYFSIATRADKDTCHGDLSLAERDGVISITWERQAGLKNQIQRIELLDRDLLARFLHVIPRWDAVAIATESLAPNMEAYPVLHSIVDLWRRGVTARSTTPADVKDWIDAIAVFEHCQASGAIDIPVRRLSARMLADSKRIENIWHIIDVIIQGDALAPMRDAEDVLNEIGLVKYPSTFLIAGDLTVVLGNKKEHVKLVSPYLGFAPSVITSFALSPQITTVLTVENLTTFHEVASKLHTSTQIILLYTGGMPSPSWKRVYELLLSSLNQDSLVFHWGDIDAGGFRIADHLASCAERSGHSLGLHAMALDNTAKNIETARRQLSDIEVLQILKICANRGWKNQAKWIEEHRVAIEQETIHIVWPLALTEYSH